MLKILTLSIIFILFTFLPASFAQYKLKGKIIDNAGIPLEFAGVGLFNDTTNIAGALTDSSGMFAFDGLKSLQYKLKASLIGKTSKESSLLLSRDTLVILVLDSSSNQLGEVVVNSKRPIFEKRIDRLVFNLSNAPITVGNNIWDVLKKTPLVKADETGMLTISGLNGATLYVNDRKINLAGEDLMNYLKSIPSDNIIKIEVITVPPSKYEAGNGGGIINIVLKRIQTEGFTGSITLSSTQAFYNSQSGSVMLNYKHKKWSQLFQCNLQNRKVYSLFNSSIYYINNPVYQEQSFLTTNVNSPVRSGYFFTATNYEINDNNTIGMMADYNGRRNTTSGTGIESRYPSGTNNANQFNDLTQAEGATDMVTANLNYTYDKHDTISKRRVDINADFLHLGSNNNSVFTSAPLESEILNYANRTNLKRNINNYSLKLDYGQQIFKNVSLEAGGKYGYSDITNPFIFYQWDNNDWVLDNNNTNYFTYKEGIGAVYATLEKQITSKLDVKLGARLENTNINLSQEIGHQTEHQNYSKLLPTAFINYVMNENNTISFSCNSDFNRPSYNSLNPFRQYASQNIYNQGNPFLMPATITGLELTYTYKGKYIFLIHNDRNRNLFSQVQNKLNDSAFIYTQANYGNSNALSFTSILNQDIVNNMWSASFTATLTNLRQNIIIQNEAYKTNDNMIYLQLDQEFTDLFHSKINGSVTAFYQNKDVSANQHTSAFFGVNFGLSRYFEKSRIKVAFYVNDVFKTNRQKYFTQANSFHSISYPDYNQQSIRLSLTKSFGKTKVKTEKRKAGNADAAGRIM